jgi:hypothetical protein
MEDIRHAYKILVGKLERKGPLGRSGRRWEENINAHISEVEHECGLDSSGSGCGSVADS